MAVDFWDLESWFFAENIWGLLGPLGVVTIGLFIGKKSKELGLIWMIMTFAMTAFYLNADFGDHLWQFFTLVLGGVLQIWNLGDSR